MSTFPNATTLTSGTVTGATVLPCSLVGGRDEVTIANLITGLGVITGSVTRLTADVPNATTAFANLADLTVTLPAAGKYVGELTLKCNNTTAADGMKLDFNGGTATMTSFWAGGGVLASGGTDTVGTNVSTSLAGVINFSVVTGETIVVVKLSFVVNAGGTFVPRIAENAHTTGTFTAELGSFLTAFPSAD